MNQESENLNKTNIISLIVGILMLLTLWSAVSTISIAFITHCSIKELREKDVLQDSLFNDMYYAVIDTAERQAFIVTVTTANPTKTQCDGTPDKTACGFKIDTTNPYKQRIVGLSRDLLQDFYYGEKVLIENTHSRYDGIYTVVDCGNRRLIRTVDIYINKNQLGGKFKNAVIRRIE